jgi:hypothetical protein
LGYTPNWKNKMYNSIWCLTRSWFRRLGTATKTPTASASISRWTRFVRDAAFDPEEIGDYARATLDIASECGGDDRDSAIARRVTDAWAVRDFLTITGAVKL